MRLSDDPNYTRLPGSSRSFLGPVQYWRGRDHLLLVEVIWLVERYRRFDFQDMVALTIRPSRLHLWLTLVFGGVMVFFGGVGVLVGLEGVGEAHWVVVGIFGILALASMAAMVWTLAQGPACEVRLTTSVQTLTLPGLRSMRAAKRFRDALVPGLAPAGTGAGDAAMTSVPSIPHSVEPAATRSEGED